MKKPRIGMVGFGTRGKTLLKTFVDLGREFTLVAVTDLNPEQAKERMIQHKLYHEDVRFFTDLDAMLEQTELDGVIIATNCSVHAELAIKVLKKGIPLFLEKPVAINMKQLCELKKAYETYGGKVVVSFPLRRSPLVETALEIIDSGKIGTIEHAQVVNNVNYGGVYYHNWFRNEAETGGLFLQKATHDFDYAFSLIRKKPVEICAMESKRIFKGDRPDIDCSECEEYYSCYESPYVIKHICGDWSHGTKCCFSHATGNHDSASAIIRFEDGSHMTYSQNFFVRRGAGKRGAVLMGYDGTISFDWQSSEIRVNLHHTPREEIYKVDTSRFSDHGGGDIALIRNFYGVMLGTEESKSPLDAGILSALVCLCAAKSAKTNQYVRIEYDD